MKTKLSTIKIAVVALGIFFSTAASAFTAVTSGNWSNPTTWGGIAPTSTVANQDIIIPVGITVTLDANVTFTGLLNTFNVAGVLTSTTTNWITVTQGALTGGGTISVNRINFNTLGTTSFSGNLNLKRLSNSTTVLAFTAIANIADTLELEAGNILLNTNGNITMQSNSTVKVNNGSITIGGGIFNSSNAYNVMYIGNSKTTGIELNSATVQNLYLAMNSNSETVTLNNNTIANGNTNISSGKIALNGKQFTMKGNLTLGAGSTFVSNATSTLIIEGAGFLTGALFFDVGSSINDLVINRTPSGMVKLGNSLSIVGHLKLMDGMFSIESGGMLTMNSASTVHVEKGALSLNTGSFIATAAYDVEYMGNTDATSGTELTGAGLNNLTVSYTASANKVTINNNTAVSGNLNMNNGSMSLNGKNMILNGTISQNSNAKFIGHSNSELHLNLTSVSNDTLFFDNSSTSNQSLSKLKINLTPTTTIVLGSKLNITNELTFIKGKVELVNDDLVILSAASITGYDDSYYVVTSQNNSGSLVMNVNAGSAYVTFPVGTSSNYSPAHIQQTSTATSGNFNVRAMNTVLSGGTYGFVNSNTLKVVNRTWFVNSSASTINANLKFGWVAAAEVNGFNRNNAYVSHYTSSAWDVASVGIATVAANNTFELSRMGMTSLSPFAVTEMGQALKVKEQSLSDNFEVYPNPSKDVINVKLSNPSDDYQYELTDITGRTISTSTNSNSLNKFDVSNLGTGCYFIKITNKTDNQTITKRFIKN